MPYPRSSVQPSFLEDTNEIIFSDEDVEVRYSDHRRLLHLVASINQIPIKQALVDTGTSVNLITLSTLQAARILEKKMCHKGYVITS